jgi:hypothetical protein
MKHVVHLVRTGWLRTLVLAGCLVVAGRLFDAFLAANGIDKWLLGHGLVVLVILVFWAVRRPKQQDDN